MPAFFLVCRFPRMHECNVHAIKVDKAVNVITHLSQ